MSDLTFKEKSLLEKLFGMQTGYVLDFSDRTYQDFIGEALGIDIFNPKYNYRSGSKANRLRGFWKVETNYKVGVLIERLLDYWISNARAGNFSYNQSDEMLYQECLKIPNRLKKDGPIDNIDALHAISDDKDFVLLEKAIRESIEKNELESALDRLHTFVVKYIRELCKKHSIQFKKDTPLHSLFGSYVIHLVSENIIESEMTVRILKSSISIMEAFNDVRNNQSFAHDNPILNYNESNLILNDVANVIHFIESIENEMRNASDVDDNDETILDDLPF
jgi:hypothetical protein